MFYTMDYVEGHSVRELIQERRQLGLGSTVRILALVAHALEHAHNYTIHRDLSPENVMVLADGSIRLLDFGLAKLTDAEPTFTRIGVTLGKHQYISPEQLISSAEVDRRTHHALGVIFHENARASARGKTCTDFVPTLPKAAAPFSRRPRPNRRKPVRRREFRWPSSVCSGLWREQTGPQAATVGGGNAYRSHPGFWQRLKSGCARDLERKTRTNTWGRRQSTTEAFPAALSRHAE